MAKALLVVLRRPDDPMAWQERLSFAEAARLPFPELEVHYAAHGRLPSHTWSRYQAVFFGGSGAYSVTDDQPFIHHGRAMLLDVLEAGVPALASCFGFQSLALALGGEVVRDEARRELGSTRVHLTAAGAADPLFGTLPSSVWVQEGHHDRVSALPPGVTRLVRGEVCEEQAFKVDGAPLWATQFHPELTVERTLERFDHYRSHYASEAEAAQLRATLAAGEESPEVAGLLARLVRAHRMGSGTASP